METKEPRGDSETAAGILPRDLWPLSTRSLFDFLFVFMVPSLPEQAYGRYGRVDIAD